MNVLVGAQVVPMTDTTVNCQSAHQMGKPLKDDMIIRDADECHLEAWNAWTLTYLCRLIQNAGRWGAYHYPNMTVPKSTLHLVDSEESMIVFPSRYAKE